MFQLRSTDEDLHYTTPQIQKTYIDIGCVYETLLQGVPEAVQLCSGEGCLAECVAGLAVWLSLIRLVI